MPVSIRSRSVPFVPAFTLVAAMLLAGCGGNKRATPEACVKAFDEAMRSGQTSKAAELFALHKWSEDNSTDWDTYSASQRDLIVRKMREDKARELEMLRPSYPQQGLQLSGTPMVQGDWATATLTGAGAALTVRLYREGEEWGIYSYAPGNQPTQ